MSLLEQEYDDRGRVEASHLAAAVFELAEKRALDIYSEARHIRLVRRQQPIETLDSVQKHLLSCLIPKGKTEVRIARQGRGELRAVSVVMNRFLSNHTAIVDPRRRQEWRRLREWLHRGERQRERERRTIQDSTLGWLSWQLWLCDGTTAQEMKPVCCDWVAHIRSQPHWWICQGRWPGDHGDMLALTYGTLVQSFS